MRARIYEASRSLRAELHRVFAFFHILFRYFRPYIHPSIDSPYKVSQVLDLFFQLPDLKNQLPDLKKQLAELFYDCCFHTKMTLSNSGGEEDKVM